MTDADEFETTNAIASELADFVSAIAKGERDAWIRRVLPEGYVEFEDRVVIADLLSIRLTPKQRGLIECPLCGRIYVESKQHDGYIAFLPEPVWVPELRSFEQSGPGGFVVSGARPVTRRIPECFPTAEDIFVAPFVRGDYCSLINPKEASAES